MIVTHGAERERPAALRELAPGGIPVIMSSQAWRDYAVPGAPYFVLADATIRGEGAATSWTALASLVSDAIADAESAAAGPRTLRRCGRRARWAAARERDRPRADRRPDPGRRRHRPRPSEPVPRSRPAAADGSR